MYIVGHTVFAYLILRPFFKFDRAINNPKTILLIFVFANIIDIVHYNFFRYLSHNLIGTFLIAGVVIIIFYKFKLLEIRTVPFLVSAAVTHVVADCMFSEYYPFFPFDRIAISIFGYDTHIGMTVESVLFLIFLVTFYLTNDYHKMKLYLHSEKKNSIGNFNSIKKFLHGLITSSLFIGFMLFTLAQLAVFIVTNKYCIIYCIWIPGIYILMFILFIIILGLIGFGKIKVSKNIHYTHE